MKRTFYMSALRFALLRFVARLRGNGSFTLLFLNEPNEMISPLR